MEKFRKIPADDLYYLPASVQHPADTYFHFSFANYYDANNMNFGPLRVINDDKVEPQKGFHTHPHNNMEIFSYVVSGSLTHQDSAGNHEVLERGDVQAISAGTGLTHSELNNKDNWCRFLQIWVEPNEKGLPINYSHMKHDLKERENSLLHIVSSVNNSVDSALKINQDFNAFVSELTDKKAKVKYSVKEQRQVYILCIEGSVDIEGFPSLNERDSLKIHGDAELEFSLTSEKAHFIILEMKLCGYLL